MDTAERLSPRARMLALGLVFLVALLLRLNGIAYGLPALNDPDELMFEMGAVRLLSGPTLNPGWFGHPATTTIYLLAVLNALVFAGGWALGYWTGPEAFAKTIYVDPSWAILPGRLAMVAFALWSIWLTWRLARELAGERVALAAVAVLAVSPLHVTYSQIIRSDMMAVCFMLLVALAALRIARGGGRRDFVLGALWLGLAIVTKWPFAVAGAAVAGAYALRVSRGEESRGGALRKLAAFGLLAGAFGLLISPFIVLDYPVLLRNLQGEAQPHHLGATGGSPLANAWWYLSGPILSSLGLAGALAAAWGLGLLARRHEALAVLLTVPALFFVLFCFQRLIWERWAVPLTPALAIAAGAGLVWLLDFVRGRLSASLRTATMTLLGLAVIVPQVSQALTDARVRNNDTRQRAAAWALAHIPGGSTILVEHFAFDLLQGPWQFRFPVGDAGCVDVRGLLGGKTQYSQIQQARDQRSNVDYGTMNPGMRGTCGVDWAVLTQYGRYRAERATFPREYAAYADLLSRGTVVASFAPEPGRSGGPPVTIVRFERGLDGQPGFLPAIQE
ncbi:hypothetical protein HNO88_000741 [Novosphingobium chloroacetimidivorans]|uniref:Glycosyltransferase RgtA/B/C/D-like domain-containing protein n=1 Tax=Novosphingobium chloroacetimidivorans TaxID=1428314 RepID=A0A7W7NVM0_9SPHN|nr:glycosyltransferase family 39 protein [Novosphingobium chloroacetimidivorans]MBB4857434.1 hypothetical protein [Novosphingobium chloroacetimidivorans]